MTGFDRQPPQDLRAEQAVLGGMLLSREAIPEVIAILRPDDFYRPGHQTLYERIVELYRRDSPADPVTVCAELQRRGILTRLGGAPYLHTLMAAVPTAANAAYYAEIVAEKAVLRRLVAAGTRIVQLGYAEAEGDQVEDVVSRARAALDGVTEPVEQADVVTLADLMTEPETAADWVVPDLLERGDRLILTGFEGTGKAVKAGTPVMTLDGWATIGDLLVGDEVFGPDGRPTKVVAATEIMEGRPCYRVRFSDGAEVVADASHSWLTETLACREAVARLTRRPEAVRPRGTDQRHRRVHYPAIVTTEQIRDTLHARGGHVLNHAIPVCAPLQFPAADLPIDPYLLGLWLGDGTTVTGALTLNREDAADIESRIGPSHRVPSGERPGSVTVRIPGFTAELDALGVLGCKHIPAAYLRASEAQRRALLAGLMDTDGSIVEARGTGRGQGASVCELSLCDSRLAADALDLLVTLGIKVRSAESDAVLNGRVVGRRWRMAFQSDRNVFHTPRKAVRWQPLRTRRAALRYVVAVDPVPSVPVRCVQVDRPDGMFVIGRECIPTHNSWLVAQLALTIAGGIHPFTADPVTDLDGGTLRVLIADVENTRQQLRRRLRRIAATVDAVRRGHGLDGVDWREAVRLVIRPEGIDLTRPREIVRLEAAAAETAPDLLVAGPLYKMTGYNTHEEEGAMKLVHVLDQLRVRHRCAIISEHHTPHAQNGQARSTRPIGSSVMLRWPEFGLGIVQHPDVEPPQEHPSWVQVRRWRGGREARDWPHELRHGAPGRLPWVPTEEYWDQVAKPTGRV